MKLKNDKLKSLSLFQIKEFSSVYQVHTDDWNQVLNNENIYLSLEFLKSIELTQKLIEIKYLIFYDNNKPVAIAYFQVIDFRKKSDLKRYMKTDLKNKIWLKYLEISKIKILVCGNTFFNGENGFILNKGYDKKHFINTLNQKIMSFAKASHIPFIIIKDIEDDKIPEHFIIDQFHNLPMHPIMSIDISENWQYFEDYLQDMNTKFRTKAKAVMNRTNDIICRQLSHSDILKWKDEMASLYSSVIKNSKFTVKRLNIDFFESISQQLDEKSILFGYFYQEHLIGFSHAIISNDRLDANFVGFDYKINSQFPLYQRMLYDFVNLAINRKYKKVILGRMAEEIKSGVGATPQNNYSVFVKHKSCIINIILSKYVKKINLPNISIRRPFKVA